MKRRWGDEDRTEGRGTRQEPVQGHAAKRAAVGQDRPFGPFSDQSVGYRPQPPLPPDGSWGRGGNPHELLGLNPISFEDPFRFPPAFDVPLNGGVQAGPNYRQPLSGFTFAIPPDDHQRALQIGRSTPPALAGPSRSRSHQEPSRQTDDGGPMVNNRNGAVHPWSFLDLEDRLALSQPAGDQLLPTESGSGKGLARLSEYMYKRSRETQQSASLFRLKVELWGQLERILGRRFRCSTHVFGSTLNGFGLSDSDMDLCIFLDGSSAVGKKDKDDIKTLSDVRKTLRREMAGRLSGSMELIPAKVPILKLYQPKGSIEVDLSCNNPNSVRNTCLLYWYSQMDWRVRPLVLTVKRWAKKAGINDAKEQTLSSYCLVLMVLHFLQAAVKPPVVPILGRTHPELFDLNSSIFNLPFKTCPTFQSSNEMSLGELLKGFFEYYCDRFDFCYDVCSVRTGDTLTSTSCRSFAKQNQASPGQWSAYVLVEEPFDRTNAGRAIIKRDRFDLILEALQKAKKGLKDKAASFAELF